MKSFRNLKYMGLAIIGIPSFIVISITIMAIMSQLKSPSYPASKVEKEKPKVDTVVVEKRVIVRDTVYIKPKIKPTPVTPVNDSL